MPYYRSRGAMSLCFRPTSLLHSHERREHGILSIVLLQFPVDKRSGEFSREEDRGSQAGLCQSLSEILGALRLLTARAIELRSKSPLPCNRGSQCRPPALTRGGAACTPVFSTTVSSSMSLCFCSCRSVDAAFFIATVWSEDLTREANGPHQHISSNRRWKRQKP